MNKDLEQAKALLENNEEYTCAACRAGESFKKGKWKFK